MENFKIALKSIVHNDDIVFGNLDIERAPHIPSSHSDWWSGGWWCGEVVGSREGWCCREAVGAG